MTRIRTRFGHNFLGLLQSQPQQVLIVIGLLANCLACEGQSQTVEMQQSTVTDALQQYVSANNYEEIRKTKPVWIADLKRRYGGTIDTSVSGPDSRAHRLRFSKLMREWNPVHCSVDDLKSIAGKPSEEHAVNKATKTYIVEYRFDDGSVFEKWIFTVWERVGLIAGVEYDSNQQSAKEKELQQQKDERATESTKNTRRQYINANTHEELAEARKAWIADLKRRYGGTIDASVSGLDSTAHSVRFSKLMREWNPIRCMADDLASIAGKPSSETKQMDESSREYTIIEYAFDNGFDSVIYTFTISAGIIHAVEYVSGE